MPYSKRWYTSKTVWVNALVITASVIELVQAWLISGDFSPIGISGLALGATNLALRFVTSESIQ